MEIEQVYAGLRKHVRTFFKGHRLHKYTWDKGPAGRNAEGFHILRAAPGPQFDHHAYLSLGSFEANWEDRWGFEFLVVTEQPYMECVELLSMVSYYHRTRTLGVGHTVPLGHPWLLSRHLDHFLVSLPYPFGPELELCDFGDDGHVHFSWLLPITKAEKDYRHEHDLEALEQKFEETQINWLNHFRESVV